MNKFLSIFLAGLLSLVTLPAFAEIVNLNKADAGAFQHYLTGIGEKRAADIIKYRKKHNSFKSVDEIMQVPGIGEGIFKKIKKDLSLTKGVTSAPAKGTKKKTSTAKSDTKTKDKAEKSSKSSSKTASDKSSDSKKKAAKKDSKSDTKKSAKKDSKSDTKKSAKKDSKSDTKKSAKKEKADKKASSKKSSDKSKS